jgi:hypothetical protein
VVLAGMWLWQSPREYDPEAAIEAVAQLGESDIEASPPVSPLRTAPRRLPLSNHVLASNAKGWRPVKLLGVEGVAYDLRIRRRDGSMIAGILYVAPANVTGLSAKRPVRPTRDSGGFAAAAWKEGGQVCLLVVQGNADSFRAFLNLPRGPIT